MKINNFILGAHFSVAGGLHKAFNEADAYFCKAMQIFTQNSSTWKIRVLSKQDISEFENAYDTSGVTDIISHCSYLINPAGPDAEKREKSFESLKGEVTRCCLLGIKKIVLHPGSHMNTSLDEGINRISLFLDEIFKSFPDKDFTILLETTAGQGSSIGSQLFHLEQIMEKCRFYDRINICVDSCHTFAAGYNIATDKGYEDFFREADSRFGIEKIQCFHLNDSKKECGSKVDRHAHIGSGLIGLNFFKNIMRDKRFLHIPKIIELPNKENGLDMHRKNFEKLKKLAIF